MNYKAWIYAKINRNEEALPLVQRSLELDPNNTDALDTIGFIFYNLGEYHKALEYFDLALKEEPNYVESLNHKHEVLQKLQETNKSENGLQSKSLD